MNGYSLEDYVRDVQRSLIPFAVDDDQSVSIKDKIDNATFLIFELLELSPDEKKIFRAHISSDLLLPNPDSPRSLRVYNRKLKRLFDNDPSFYHDLKAKGYLPKGIELPAKKGWKNWTDSKKARKVLDKLLFKYRNTPISPNLGTTAVVYQSWKQGTFYDYWYKGENQGDFESLKNKVENTLYLTTDSLSEEKLIHLLNKLATSFHLKATDLSDKISEPKPAKVNQNMSFDDYNGEVWSISNDKDFFTTELSLIHKIYYTSGQSSNKKKGVTAKKYYLVHYPLILDKYWFTGFGYFLAEKDKQRNKAELFNINKYYKCLDLLNETFGMPLKNALRNRVLNSIDWQKPITKDVLLRFLRQYFACFDFREMVPYGKLSRRDEFPYSFKKYKKKIADKKGTFLLPDDVELVVSVPKWVKDNYKTHLIAEITSLLKEINRLKNDAESIKTITEKHGSKAASVSIMSRNLSHNDGSHGIAYWITEIGNILETTWSCEEKGARPLSSCARPPLRTALLKSKELFQYLQHRMDFLAEVSTSVPCSELSLNIDADILTPTFTDPLGDVATRGRFNIDKLQRSILLQYIAQSEGLNLHQKIEFIAEDVRLRRVSIPNGLVGNHAIYSILENFLRNAAKHYTGTVIKVNEDMETAKLKCRNAIGSVMTYQNLLVTENSKKLSRKRYFPTICRVECVNNCTETAQCRSAIKTLHHYQNGKDSLPIIRIKIDEIKGSQNYHDRYVSMTIWDMRENSCNQNIVSELRKYLPEFKFDERFLSKDGILQPGGWGIKEMLISANFLRKNSADKLYEIIKQGKEATEPPLIEILCGEDSDNDLSACKCNVVSENGHGCLRNTPYACRLGWRFYLRKPKDLAIAAQGLINESIKAPNLFEINELKKNELKEEIPHRMLLVKAGQKDLYKDNPYVPCRVMEADSTITKDDLDTTYINHYKKFLKEILQPTDFEGLSLIFTGPKYNDYADLFAELSSYGQAVDAELIETDEKQNIIFYHHAKQKCKEVITGIQRENIKDTLHSFFSKHNSVYFQDISGGYSFNLRVSNVAGMDSKLKEHLLLELTESAMTNVIIIDERVSTWADQEWIHGQPFTIRELLQYMNIFVVKVVLEEVTLDNLITELNKFTARMNHFFVVHQGVMEKIADAEVQELFDTIRNCRWKVVDSGRGVQKEKIKKYEKFNVRFVEISALLKMLENFDKHALVQSLFATRNPIKDNGGV